MTHTQNATLEIKNYTAIFFLEDERVGSGVFVNTCGYNGILTAHHVAEPVLKAQTFALCIADHEHTLWHNAEHFEHVPIGWLPQNPEPQNGPDLSFIIIRDANLLEILNSKKSFCFLESQKTDRFERPLDAMRWGVAGSPYHYRERFAKSLGDFAIKLPNMVAVGLFHSHKVRSGFDYVQLKMPCDGERFPSDYQGVSGGGIRGIAFKANPPNFDLKSVTHDIVLGGIAFYQSEANDGWRIVTGHGFDSIYRCLRKTLKEKTASP